MKQEDATEEMKRRKNTNRIDKARLAEEGRVAGQIKAGFATRPATT